MVAWQDATGETDVMREGAPSVEGLTAPDAALANSRRLRRIAEAAFWDSLAGLLHSSLVTDRIPQDYLETPFLLTKGKCAHFGAMLPFLGGNGIPSSRGTRYQL